MPKRVRAGEYVLTVTNPTLAQANLSILSARCGAVTRVTPLALPRSEVGALGYLPHGYEGTDVGRTTASTLAGGDTAVLRVGVAEDGSCSEVSEGSTLAGAAGAGLAALPAHAARLLRLPAHTGSLRAAVTARAHFDAAFSGLLVDWEYVEERTPAALAREGDWLALHNVSIAVDFTRSLLLFPTLRLVNDRGDLYAQSMARMLDVIGKLPLLRGAHALLALHSLSELPPANFSADPLGLTRASVTATLRILTAAAAGVNATLHLRRSARNDELAGAGLAAQASYAAAAGVLLAPALAYSTVSGDGAQAVASAFAAGSSKLLLLSSAWQAYEGRAGESGLLAEGLAGAGGGALCAWLAAAHEAAVAAGGVVVMDAGYTSVQEEMADVRALDACLLAQRGRRAEVNVK